MEVITRRNAAAAAKVSQRTLDRLHVAGLGPPRIQITERRVGYDTAVFERWLASRTFASRAAALAAGATTAAAPQPPRKNKRRKDCG